MQTQPASPADSACNPSRLSLQPQRAQPATSADPACDQCVLASQPAPLPLSACTPIAVSLHPYRLQPVPLLAPGFSDLPLVVEEILAQRGALVRALAHPLAFNSNRSRAAADGAATTGGGGGGGQGFIDFETFGAVPVSGKVRHKW